MVRSRELGSDFDLVYEAGRQKVIEDESVYAQGFRVALTTLKGEQPFHPSFGIDLAGVTSQLESARRAALHSAAIRSRRVRQITTIERISEPDKNRKITYIVGGLLPTGNEIRLNVVVD